MQHAQTPHRLHPSLGTGDLGRIEPLKCRELLGTKTIGRITWSAADGPIILPVSYIWESDTITFSTAPQSVLSELVRPCDVAFAVDDFDRRTHSGWRILVQGRAGPVPRPRDSGHFDAGMGLPWAHGARNVYIQIKARDVTGYFWAPRRQGKPEITSADGGIDIETVKRMTA